METGPKNHRRLFFALWPNAAERAALAAWQPTLQELCGGRAMRPETLHCTLLFLGNVAAHRLEALTLAAREVVMHPFTLELAAAHCWGHNRIVYAAPTSLPPELAGLVAGLEAALHRHRFHFDARDYQPHVTLLRAACRTDGQWPPVPVVRWDCRDFVLLESRRAENGARYEVLARFGCGITCFAH